ncbi:uncharacterized protein DUF2779 [Mycoplasmopsis mustelae]|uniref:Uncharacterized protein DUF2779 n=1 Tax=Mycoplasmopsis mustelae TaxID=171289 RepID=A0A4R7UE32_9BACT|nr:DUF2779 domain-containing protein [Mycoplasmopsis mustelae]TDV22852.1 uncharacterized protein DUF2779 [Mycoplasmopsis mustelae]
MLKNNIKITWNIFKRVFGYNPALIWTGKTLLDELKKEIQKNSNLQIYIETDDEDNNDEEKANFYELFEEINNLHEISLEVKSTNESYIKVSKDNYERYTRDAFFWYLKKYQIPENNVAYISSKADYTTKHIETIEAIRNPHIDIIFSGNILLKQNEFDFVAPFFIFDKKREKIVLLSYTTRTKFEMYYKHFYIYNIFKYNQIKISDMSVIIIDPLVKVNGEIKKDIINFYESYAAISTKSISKTKNRNASPYQVEIDNCLKKSGDILLLNSKNEYDKQSKNNFIWSVKSKKFPKKSNKIDFLSTQETKFNWDYKNFKITVLQDQISEPIYIEDFHFYVNLVTKAYKEFQEKCNFAAIKYFSSFNEEQRFKENQRWLIEPSFYNQNLDYFEISDSSYINKEEKLLLLKLYLGKDFDDISMSFFNKKSKLSLTALATEMKRFNKNDNYFNIEALNQIINLHQKDAKVCWYDYEGFSDLYPPLDGIAPYNQVVNQVSVIITQNGVEISCENIVLDTKDLTIKGLVEVIEAIYANKCDSYVVYNKTYENTRNKEIAKLVENTYKKDPDFRAWLDQKYNNLNDFIIKIVWINNNTIDLADCFSAKNRQNVNVNDFGSFTEVNNELKLVENKKDFIKNNLTVFKKLININFLKYYFSIKKIEKYITHMNLNLKHKIIPYNELIIQKGTMAMEEAILRYLGATNDIVWINNIVPNLKKYCENDVRAMIMVYDFIMYLFSLKFKNLSDFEYKLINAANTQYIIKDSKLTIQEKSRNF